MRSIHYFLHTSPAFTFHSQRSRGRAAAGFFRHNCQSTYPPTSRRLQSPTVPQTKKWKHHVSFSLYVVIVLNAYGEKFQRPQMQNRDLPVGPTAADHVSDTRRSTRGGDLQVFEMQREHARRQRRWALTRAASRAWTHRHNSTISVSEINLSVHRPPPGKVKNELCRN